MNLLKILSTIKPDSPKKLLLPLLILIGMLFIAFGNFTQGNKPKPATANVETTNETQYLYDLQGRLENVLSQINGAGEVKVMLTLAASSQNVIATDEKISENITETTKITNKDTKIVTSKNEPLIIQELKPKIEGVVIVSTGAKNPNIALQINKAVVALTGVKTHKVVVLEKSK